jgi:hypothetical protein
MSQENVEEFRRGIDGPLDPHEVTDDFHVRIRVPNAGLLVAPSRRRVKPIDGLHVLLRPSPAARRLEMHSWGQ